MSFSDTGLIIYRPEDGTIKIDVRMHNRVRSWRIRFEMIEFQHGQTTTD